MSSICVSEQPQLLQRHTARNGRVIKGYKNGSCKPPSPTFNNDPFNSGDAEIISLAHDDDPDLLQPPPQRRYLAKLISVTSLVAPILGFYTSWVQSQALTELGQTKQLSLKQLFGTSFLLAFEVLTCVQVMLVGIVKLQALSGKWRPRLRILGRNVPSVDVLVPICREPLDLVQDTIRATLNLDYPRSRYRVVVTDDGKSAALRSWVEQLAKEFPNLHYTARETKGDWKAGNLNHAIKFTESLPGGRGEFIAGLDADMIPERKWLRAVVPHIVQNSNCGVVCPAQLFYNVPKNDPLVQSRLREWRCTNITGDLTGNGWNLGSGWVIRPKALEDIGGFPGTSLIEDVYSTFLMQAQGLDTIYLTETLQFGLVPTSYLAHVNQFTRWYIGGAQIFFRFNGFLDSRKTKHMPFLTKMMGFQDGIWAHLNCHLNSITWCLTPFFFLSNTNMAYWRNDDEMVLFLRLHCAIALVRYAHTWLHGLLSGYKVSVHTQAVVYMMPYYTIVWLRAFILPEWLGGQVAGFTPTGAIHSPVYERDPTRRAPVIKRLRYILFDCGAWLHLCIAVAFVVCVGIHVREAIDAHLPTNEGRRLLFINLLQTVGWPTHPWFINAIACLGPIRYALFPPDVPPRHSFFGEKNTSGAKYLKKAEMESTCTGGFYSRWELGFVQLYTMFMMYVAVLFVISWWI